MDKTNKRNLSQKRALSELRKVMEGKTSKPQGHATLATLDILAGTGGYKSGMSSQRCGKKSIGITDKFMYSVNDNDVELDDCEYYSGDSLVDMEASQAVVAVMAEIMAFPKTRKILMRSALKSRYNAAEHVTYVARLVALMKNGTWTETKSRDKNNVVNVAGEIFLLLDEKLYM